MVHTPGNDEPQSQLPDDSESSEHEATAIQAAPPSDLERLPWVSQLLRMGFALVAASWLAALFANNRPIVQQLDGLFTYRVTGITEIGLPVAALMIVVALWHRLWVKLTGLLLATAAAVFLFLGLLGARSNDVFLTDVDVALGSGGWILYGAGIAACLGVALVVISLSPSRTGYSPDAVWSRAGVWVLLAGLLAVLGAITAPLAIVMGAQVSQARRDSGRPRGKTVTVGIVVAWLAIVGWLAGLLIGGLTVQPAG